MQPSEEKNPLKLVIFIIVGVILVGVVTFGVVWAKNRADFYANQAAPEVAQEQKPAEETPKDTSTPENSASTDKPEVASAQNNQTAPTPMVPAAGAESTVLSALALVVFTFFAVRFVQSSAVKTL